MRHLTQAQYELEIQVDLFTKFAALGIAPVALVRVEDEIWIVAADRDVWAYSPSDDQSMRFWNHDDSKHVDVALADNLYLADYNLDTDLYAVA